MFEAGHDCWAMVLLREKGGLRLPTSVFFLQAGLSLQVHGFFPGCSTTRSYELTCSLKLAGQDIGFHSEAVGREAKGALSI